MAEFENFRRDRSAVDQDPAGSRQPDEPSSSQQPRVICQLAKYDAISEVIQIDADEIRFDRRSVDGASVWIVGDVAQTSSLAGAPSWASVLERYQGDRWRLAGLTINYRTTRRLRQ